MTDNFREEVAVKRANGLNNALYYLGWIVMILSVIMALIGLQNVIMMLVSGAFDLLVLITMLLFGAIAFVIWRYKDNLRTEYEYTFTNGELDVSMVLNNQKRKYLTNINMKNVEAAGPVNGSAFQRYVTMPGVKKHNWFLNREAKLYFYYFTKNSVKHLIVLELSDTMADLTRRPNYMGFGVWQG